MRTVTDLGWEPDGTLLVSWVDDDAIRCEGAVSIRQTIRVEPTEQYADGIDRVRSAALALVSDALDDWRGSETAIRPQRALAEQVAEDIAAELEDVGDEDEGSDRNWRAIQAAQQVNERNH